MRWLIALVAAAAALMPAPLPAEFSQDAWRYSKPIDLPAGVSEGGLVEVVPDLEVFASAAPLLWDLRVVETATSEEVPYKLLVERGEQRRRFIPVSMRDLGSVPGRSTSFQVDVGGEGILHNELEIQTPSRNFQRGVAIEGSADGRTWALLQDKGQIYDFTIAERSFTQRFLRVPYPASTARYLRVTIADNGDPPLQITGAGAYSTQELPPRQTAIPAAITRREEQPADRKSLLFLDLGSQGFPSSKLSLETGQQNFHRQVRLEGSNDDAAWAFVQDGAVYAYNTPKFVGSKLHLDYPESAYRYFRLTVFNEDNPPLPIAGAQAHGYLRKLIFPASPARGYALFYGHLSARTPSYELERVFPYLVTENLPQAGLGAQASNARFAAPSEPSRPLTERTPWLLTTGVAVAGLLVGLLLANLLREIKKLLPPPASP